MDEKKRYIIEFVTDAVGAQRAKQAMKDLGTSQTRLRDSSKSLGDEFGKLAKRAALTIPAWFLLRGSFTTLINEFKAGIQYIVEFDKALARAGAVTSGVNNIDKFLSETLRPLARQLSVETGKSAAEAAEAFYRFGTAGLDAQVSIAGMNTSVKLATALMGDVTQTATVLADVYKILGDSVTGAVTPQEKMEKIAGTITILYKRNAFELSQFAQSMQRAGTSASLANVTFEQMSALIATLASFGLRGARAGTALERAFRYLEIRSDLVNSIIGDKANGLNSNFEKLIALVETLGAKPLTGGLATINKDLSEIFGVRGASGVSIIAKNLKDLRDNYEAITRVSGQGAFVATLEELDRQTQTLAVQSEIFKNLRRQSFEYFASGIAGTKNMVEGFKSLNESIKIIIPSLKLLGEATKGFFNVGANLNVNNLFKAFTGSTLSGVSGGLFNFFEEYKKEVNKVEQISLSQQMQNIMKQFQEEADVLAQQNASLDIQLQKLEGLKVLGLSDLEIAKMKQQLLQDQVTTSDKRLKIEQDILKLEQQQVEEIGGKIRTGFEDGLRSLLEGEGLSTFSDKLKDAFSGAFKDEIVGGISDLFSATGVFEQFGNIGVKIREAFGGVKEKIIGGHIEGATQAAKIIASGYVTPLGGGGGTIPFISGGGGASGGLSPVYAHYGVPGSYRAVSGTRISGYIPGGNMTMPIAGKTTGAGATGFLTKLFGGGTSSQVVGMLASGALAGAAGYSAGGLGGLGSSLGMMGLFGGLGGLSGLSSIGAAAFGTQGAGMMGTAAGGLSGAYGQMSNLLSGPMGMLGGGLSLLGGGLNLFSGIRAGNNMQSIGGGLQAAGGAMMLTGVGAPIGVVMSLVGSVLSMFGGGKSTTSVQQTTREISTSSKIDVTNRKLDIINRNLVSFKTTFDTYVLSESAYFSERSGNDVLTDNYALSAYR